MKEKMNVRVIDFGEEIKKGNAFMLKPSPDKCQECAVKHEPHLPHNKDSLHYQYKFYYENNNRWPTWEDAMSHCSDEMKQIWVKALKEKCVKVN